MPVPPENRRIHDPAEYAWYLEPQKLNWTLIQTIGAADLAGTFLPPGYLYEIIWVSPTFDLRPDLGALQNARINAVPIWSNSCRLYIQLVADASAAGNQPVLSTANFNVRASDFLNTTANYQSGGSSLQQLPQIEVSHNFAVIAPATTAVATFVPPGNVAGYGAAGYPIRFWRLQLTMRFLVETGLPIPVPPSAHVPTAMGFQAAMY